MEIQEAVMAFSQSEKIKSGLIWVSQSLQLVEGLPSHEQAGGMKTLRAICGMIMQEVQLAIRIGGGESWRQAETSLDNALVMLDSGVGAECVEHVTRALSQVTNIGQQAMILLKQEGAL